MEAVVDQKRREIAKIRDLNEMKTAARSHPHELMVVAELARSGKRLAQKAMSDLVVEALKQETPFKSTYLAAYSMELIFGMRDRRARRKKR